MKYESTILKRLIDTYGVVGNPRYISEIIKEFIVRGKERFPELFTYQADWLAHIDEFGLNPSYTVSYTGQSIYAPNTLERPVKSAILKGNTLVNMLSISNTSISNNTGVEYKYNITPTIGKTYLIKLKINSIGETSSAHPVKIELFSSTDSKGYFDITSSNYVVGNEIIKTITAIDGNRLQSNSIVIWCRDLTSGIFDVDITMFEYQNGMENWDIPYFEGMQSVKMPGLTTTGKNLFDGEWEIGGIGNNNGVETGGTSNVRSVNYINVKPNTAYVVSSSQLQHANVVVWYAYDKNKNFISSSAVSRLFTTPSNCEFIRVRTFDSDSTNMSLDCVLQIEQGTQATTYEPYQSNILTVNEEVELRGIGDVKDTLDCLTGEIVSNFSTYSFSDVDNWKTNTEANCQRFTLRISPSPIGSDYSDKVCIISDKLPGVKWNQSWNTVNTISCNGDSIAVQLPLGTTIEQFKELIRGSKIVYRIKSSIKTVDLTILDQNGQNIKQLMSFNGGTHFNTRSSEGSPLPSVSVSVETDLEETLKMCSLDGNTM